MRVKVVVAPVGAGPTAPDALTTNIHCGGGQQILRWLAYAACAQLAYRRGEVLGRYVPQSVISRDGTVLDVDLVLSEVAADGDELLVEHSSGPAAFRTRWELRPKTPPLSWDGEPSGTEPSPSAWLAELDLAAEGLAALAVSREPEQPPAGAAAARSAVQQPAPPPPQEQQQPEAGHQEGQQPPAQAQAQQQQQQQQQQAQAQQQQDPQADLEHVRAVLQQHAGALQALFLLFTCEASTPVDAISRMSLPQFKAFLHAAKVTSSSLPPERLDELFAAAQATPGALARRGQEGQASNSLDLTEFLVALVHAAHHRFAAESFGAAPSSTRLSTKLLSLLQDCVFAHLFPELQRRLEKLRSAVTPPAQALLRKGRRLTEQALERCQIRRVRSKGGLRVPAAHVLKHLERWGLLGREAFTLAELAPVLVFAQQAGSDPYRFVLQPPLLALDYDAFERVLLGIALLQARVRKRDADEMLGELLELVFKRSGVLVVPA